MNAFVRRYLYFCHFAVPVLFLGAAVLHYYDRLFLRWEFVSLLTIAAIPFLLPLLALYIRGIGKDGVIFNNVFSGSVFPATLTGVPIVPPSDPAAPPRTLAKKTLSDYSRAARKVLRTLRRFQLDHFKEDTSKRWAFGVHPMAIDYDVFEAGTMELRRDGLIQDDGRGMVFLSDAGIDFCGKNAQGFDGGGDTWEKFGAA